MSSESSSGASSKDDATPALRVAVVGAGPAGFFATEALLKQDFPVRVDIFNRLPTPHGLVRDGVAPDHQAIKSVTRVYERLLARDEVRYFGNVEVGTDLTIEDLRSHYDHILYAVGAQTDRRLGIPGEDLQGSWAATQFVGWYNGHPDYRDLDFDLSHPNVVVVGNGNVAIDVARILVLSQERLGQTDIADHALEALEDSAVRDITLLGRRGPAQASFTNPELREFGELDGVSVDVRSEDVDLDPVSRAYADEDNVRKRNMATLEGYADSEIAEGDRVVRFRFLVSPVEILGEDGRVTGVRAEINELYESEDGSMRPRGTGAFETFECGLVLRSVGYRGEPVPGVPFEARRGVIPNHEGRVMDPDGQHVPGEYVVGWAKRGPSGVIGTNKADAAETVRCMIEDWEAGGTTPGSASGDCADLLASRDVCWIDADDWRTLDAHEVAAGEAQGRPRVKVCTVEEMLAVMGKAT